MARQTTVTFNYSGSTATWTVPSTMLGTSISLDVRGSSAASTNASNGAPGAGARIQGLLAATPGQVFTLYVGGNTFGYHSGGIGGAGANGGTTGEAGGGSSAVITGGVLQCEAGGGGGGGGYSTLRFPPRNIIEAFAGGNGGTGGLSGTAGRNGVGTNPGAGGANAFTSGNGNNGAAGSVSAGANAGGGGGGGGAAGGDGGVGGNSATGQYGTGGGGGGASSSIGIVSSAVVTDGFQVGQGQIFITYTNADPPGMATLLSPANNAVLDLAAGFTANWAFNPTNSGDTQSAWAFARKQGVTVQWWNAGSSSWSSSEVWNTGSANSVTFPAGQWSDGNTHYTWNVNTKNSYGQAGVYTLPTFSVTGAIPPTVVMTSPSGGNIYTANAVVMWTFSPAVGGDTQTNYRVLIYPYAFTQQAGFQPGVPYTSGTGTQNGWVDDSGTVSSAATFYRSLVNLTNGTQYQAYVYVTESNGAQSGWITTGSPFTVAFDPLAAPSLKAWYDSALNRVGLRATIHDNMLGTQPASFDYASAPYFGWTPDGNTALALSSPDSSGAYEDRGDFSLKMTSRDAGGATSISTQISTAAGTAPISPSVYYFMTARVRATGSTAHTVDFSISWYTAGSVFIQTDVIASAVSSSSAWVTLAGWKQSPAGAAIGVLKIAVEPGAASVYSQYVDSVGIFPYPDIIAPLAVNPSWSRGGLRLDYTPLVRMIKSDDGGASWQTIRNAFNLSVDLSSMTTQVYDYEAPNGSTRLYRAVNTANVNPGPTLITSSPSPIEGAPVEFNSFWLKDPIDPTANLSVHMIAGFKQKTAENLTVHTPLSRVHPVIVADSIMGIDGTAVFLCKTDDEYRALLKLVLRQRVLLLQSAYEEQQYIRRTTDIVQELLTTGGPEVPYRKVSFDYLEVDPPSI